MIFRYFSIQVLYFESNSCLLFIIPLSRCLFLVWRSIIYLIILSSCLKIWWNLYFVSHCRTVARLSLVCARNQFKFDISLQFDWEGDLPIRYPQKDLVIYEMHVRGFTQHDSSKTEFAGTYRGVVEKLDHLQVPFTVRLPVVFVLQLEVFLS